MVCVIIVHLVRQDTGPGIADFVPRSIVVIVATEEESWANRKKIINKKNYLEEKISQTIINKTGVSNDQLYSKPIFFHPKNSETLSPKVFCCTTKKMQGFLSLHHKNVFCQRHCAGIAKIVQISNLHFLHFVTADIHVPPNTAHILSSLHAAHDDALDKVSL